MAKTQFLYSIFIWPIVEQYIANIWPIVKQYIANIWPIVKQYIANRPKVYSTDLLFRRFYFRVFSRQDFLLANFQGLFPKSVFPRNYSAVYILTQHFSHAWLYMYDQLELVNPGYICTVN